jgi:choline dehydrogenase-like flavoprotein
MAASCAGSRGAFSVARSINGMLYLRGHSLEYDQWAQLGCHGWSFEQGLPYFKRAEANPRGAK